MKHLISQALSHIPMSDCGSKPEPVYCPHCGKEKRQVLREIPLIGKRWTVIACECEIKRLEDFKREQELKRKKERIIHALKLSSTLDEIKKLTFENLKMRHGLEKAYEEVVDAVKRFEDRKELGILILGESGSGKSHLTAAGGNELIKRGYSVIFLTEKDLLTRLKSAQDYRNKESFQEIMDACLTADLLIWDDFLSSQKLSDEERDWIFQIFNGRERGGRPIWATSNLTVEEFESPSMPYILDDKGRTWWRIVGNMNVVVNRATNYRRAKAEARVLGIDVDEYDRRLRKVAQ